MRHQVLEFARRLALRIFDDLGDPRVGQPGARMHHRGIEATHRNLSTRRDVHFAHHAKAVDFRHQRTQAVGQHFRQHRDHAAREINRIAALTRCQVDDVAVLDIVADVGDGYPELEPLASAFAVNRVVEILCGFAVDGYQRQVAQVFASLEILVGDAGRKLRRGFFNFGGKFVRQIVLS